MTEQSDSWKTITEAATALGISENAIRVRIRRGKLLASRSNDGHIRVNIDHSRPELSTRLMSTHCNPIAPTDSLVPLSAIIEQQDRHQAQLIEQQARANAETARQLAERDALHQDTLERLADQTALERSLWLERIDAAELRAERLEQRFDQVLNQLLTERHQLSPNQITRQPWWRRWFSR